jgi:hypothetical protein
MIKLYGWLITLVMMALAAALEPMDCSAETGGPVAIQ